MGEGASTAIEFRAFFIKALTWSRLGDIVMDAIFYYLCVSLSFRLCRLFRKALLEPCGLLFCSATPSELAELLFDNFFVFSFEPRLTSCRSSLLLLGVRFVELFLVSNGMPFILGGLFELRIPYCYMLPITAFGTAFGFY